MWAHTWRANATKYTIDRYSGFDWMVGTDGRECAAGSDGALSPSSSYQSSAIGFSAIGMVLGFVVVSRELVSSEEY